MIRSSYIMNVVLFFLFIDSRPISVRNVTNIPLSDIVTYGISEMKRIKMDFKKIWHDNLRCTRGYVFRIT